MPAIVSEPPVVDARGLLCPLPLVRLSQALRRLPAGGQVRLLATDPGTPGDVQALCAQDGHRVLEHTAEAGQLNWLIEKAGGEPPLAEV